MWSITRTENLESVVSLHSLLHQSTGSVTAITFKEIRKNNGRCKPPCENTIYGLKTSREGGEGLSELGVSDVATMGQIHIEC